jgi:hypothetical protein
LDFSESESVFFGNEVDPLVVPPLLIPPAESSAATDAETFCPRFFIVLIILQKFVSTKVRILPGTSCHRSIKKLWFTDTSLLMALIICAG